MAICEACERDMRDPATITCEAVLLRYKGDARKYLVLTHAGPETCVDCGVSAGGYHHVGCDQAKCPRCRYPILSSGCHCVLDEIFEPKPELMS